MISLITIYANGLCGLPQTLQPPELPSMTSAAACSEPSLASSNDYTYPWSLLCSSCWCGGASYGLLFLTLEMALNPWQYSKASCQFFLPPFEVPLVSSLPVSSRLWWRRLQNFHRVLFHCSPHKVTRNPEGMQNVVSSCSMHGSYQRLSIYVVWPGLKRVIVSPHSNSSMACLDSQIWAHGFRFEWFKSKYFIWIVLKYQEFGLDHVHNIRDFKHLK